MDRLRNVKIIKPLFVVRDWFMDKTGLFETKAKIKQYFYFRKARKEDDRRRMEISHIIYNMKSGILLLSQSGLNVTVSMTSYGKRVETTAPYAIYSVLTQKMRPNRIVLNLDENTWNDENIPDILKELKTIGIEINYVHDVGPHTKLLPTLKKYSEDIIITMDDDVYYDDTAIKELMTAYDNSDKKTVICRNGKRFIKQNGCYLKYSELPHLNADECKGDCLPFGVAGVLYPPHIFSSEIFNESVFRKLCPSADDIWFAVIELRDKINTKFVFPNSWNGSSDVDRNEEYNVSVSEALYRINDIQGKNDIQFKALLDYYNLN